MAILAPSILSCDFTRLGEEIKLLESKNVSYVHIDVMDGLFVPNISIGVPVVASLRKITNLVFDVHLMIIDPERYIEAFANAGSDIINIHYEACKDCESCLKAIKLLGKKAAITIKPHTDYKEILPFLPLVDMVLVMSVEPGFGGQSFISESLYNLKSLAQYKKENNMNFDIEIDGGVNLDNAEMIANSGADIIVAGSAIFKGNTEENIEKFQKIMEKTI